MYFDRVAGIKTAV